MLQWKLNVIGPLQLKLWTATLRMLKMEKACRKISKWPSPGIKNEIFISIKFGTADSMPELGFVQFLFFNYLSWCLI